METGCSLPPLPEPGTEFLPSVLDTDRDRTIAVEQLASKAINDINSGISWCETIRSP